MSTVDTVDTVVIGAGQAGLATSRLLTAAGREHVVLERGHIGERWRSERWDSLRLLTPNWVLSLPGSRYGGPHPDAFAPADSFVEMLEEYAASFAAPVVDGTTVEEVRASGRGTSRYAVTTDGGTWYTRHLVVATGPHGVPTMPAGLDDHVAGDVQVLTARDYRNPAQVARRRRARRRCLRIGRADRRGAPARRPSGHARGRPSRAAASDLPGLRRLLVARGDRPAEPHARRRGGPRGCPARAFPAADRATPRPTARLGGRPGGAATARRAADGAAARAHRRDRPLRRGPVDPRHRGGARHAPLPRRRRRLRGAIRARPGDLVTRASACRSAAVAHTHEVRPARRGDLHPRRGDRLPAAPSLAPPARARGGGRDRAGGRHHLGTRASTPSDSASRTDGARARSSGRASTRRMSWTTSSGRAGRPASARRERHEQVRRRRRRRPGGGRLDRPAARSSRCPRRRGRARGPDA